MIVEAKHQSGSCSHDSLGRESVATFDPGPWPQLDRCITQLKKKFMYRSASSLHCVIIVRYQIRKTVIKWKIQKKWITWLKRNSKQYKPVDNDRKRWKPMTFCCWEVDTLIPSAKLPRILGIYLEVWFFWSSCSFSEAQVFVFHWVSQRLEPCHSDVFLL